MFGSRKILRNEKNAKKNGLLMFGFTTKIQQKIKYNYNQLKTYIFLNYLIFI